MRQSSLRVPDGIEGLTWPSEPTDEMEEDEQFYGFKLLRNIAITNKVVSSPYTSQRC